MGKGYLPLFFDTFDETSDLTDEEFGRLIRAAGSYANGTDDWEEIITGNEKYAFRFLRGQIDRNIKISKARSIAGSTRKGETNENKEEQTETKPINNTKKRNIKKSDTDTNQWFDRFWDAYPRHENKQSAMKAFEKAKVDADLLENILKAIERQKQSAQWKENGGQFIPHPATWLNGHRWEDEIKEYRETKTVTGQQFTQRDYSNEDEEALRRMLEMEGVRA